MGHVKPARLLAWRTSSACLLSLLLFFNRAGHERPDRPSFSAPSAPPSLTPRRILEKRPLGRLHGFGGLGKLMSCPKRPPLVARSAYVTLQQETLPDLRTDDVAQELFHHWSLDSLLVKSLVRSGASHLFVSKHEGHKQLSFEMKMNIPWQQVQTVEKWTAETRMPTNSAMLVRGIVTSLRSKERLTVEIKFEMETPVVRRLLPRLQLFIEPGDGQSLKVWIGGLLEWKECCHFLVRRPMEHGFMLGLGRFARAILEELRSLSAVRGGFSDAVVDGPQKDPHAARRLRTWPR
mmetsp:Transcript_61238/g.143291  ORF Transcript_61238/g.143291 Transcript_61238/m.143291 type:complete len:292 (+) Transcript_61238:60-935(+)